MKTIRIIFNSRGTGVSMAFLDVQCEHWSVDGFCLQLIKDDGSVVYYPLLGIQSFREVLSEAS